MMTRSERVHGFPTTRPLRRVVVASKHPIQPVLEALLEAGNYDVVVVESTAHAYSRIKQETPGLVIVCLSTDDLESLQVLSMLKLDSETARIPVLTYTMAPPDRFVTEAASAGNDIRRQPPTVN